MYSHIYRCRICIKMTYIGHQTCILLEARVLHRVWGLCRTLFLNLVNVLL